MNQREKALVSNLYNELLGEAEKLVQLLKDEDGRGMFVWYEMLNDRISNINKIYYGEKKREEEHNNNRN